MNTPEVTKKLITKEQVPLNELQTRMNRFRAKMEAVSPEWEMAIIISKVNLYYFTGTIQDGMLIIPRDNEAQFWVRRSYERALDESLFPNIKLMGSFRDVAASISKFPETIFMETEILPLALYQRMQKHFPFKEVRSVDGILAAVRAVKSSYEISLMEQSGRIHQLVMEEYVPKMLRENISEADLAGEIYSALLKEGHDGILRVGTFDSQIEIGLVSFGESSLYPTYFAGPGGNYGISTAMPFIGSRERKLKKGDLVHIDVGCAVYGYNSDKTMTYMFGESLPQEVVSDHQKCVEIQNQVAEMLKPGAIPAQIYKSVMNNLSQDFLENFMGFGKKQVKFLGHGIGLLVDEWPAIAEGFSEPLEEGMAFAIEPKKGFANIGMVGIENTFLVTPKGGRNITGSNPGLIPVY